MKSQKYFKEFLSKNVSRKIILTIIIFYLLSVQGVNINKNAAKFIFSKNELKDSIKNLSLYFKKNLHHNKIYSKGK